MQLYIGGIDPQTDERQLYDYFSKFGHIESVKLYTKYGFVSTDQETGDKILKEPHVFENKTLAVEIAKGEKQDRPAYPEPYIFPYGAQKPFRAILEQLPKELDLSELKSFVLDSGLKASFMKVLPSGDAMLEFPSKRARDHAITALDGKELNGETVHARLGRRRAGRTSRFGTRKPRASTSSGEAPDEMLQKEGREPSEAGDVIVNGEKNGEV